MKTSTGDPPGLLANRGEIWLVNLDPLTTDDSARSRLCVVVSPAELHEYLRTIIIAPLKTGGCPAPFRPGLSFRGKQGLILLDQVRSLDKSRLVRRMGAVSARTLKRTLRTLQDLFAEN